MLRSCRNCLADFSRAAIAEIAAASDILCKEADSLAVVSMKAALVEAASFLTNRKAFLACRHFFRTTCGSNTSRSASEILAAIANFDSLSVFTTPLEKVRTRICQYKKYFPAQSSSGDHGN